MAFCARCAAPNLDTAAACAACGSPMNALPGAQAAFVPQPSYGAPNVQTQFAPRTSGLAIAGFICAFLCALPGLIMSIRAYNQCKSSGGMIKGEGLALAGIIISSIMLVLGVILRIAALS
jgi:hypothetical protein